MAVGFDGNAFRVALDDEGRLPHPISDETSVRTLTVTAFIDTSATLAALEALVSTVTVIPALGGGGLVKTKSGPGVKVLIYPGPNGAEVSRYAVLTGFDAAPFNGRDIYHRADLTFLVGDAV